MNIWFENELWILVATVSICVGGYFGGLLLIKDPYLKGVLGQFAERIKKEKLRDLLKRED